MTNRTEAIVRDLLTAFNEVMDKHNITHDEYRAGVAFLTEAAEAGETTLLHDALLEASVVTHDNDGPQAQVLGPYYLPDAPILESGQLAGEEESGERVTLTGVVQDTSGNPLPNATLDIWQSDAEGRYSNFDEGTTPGNLRGKVVSGQDGSYSVHTVVPAPYQIPHAGPTGRVLEVLGRHPWRPAHIHMIVSADGYEPLTTQIYFEGDPYLDSDSVRAAKPELAFPLEDSSAGKTLTFNPVLDT